VATLALIDRGGPYPFRQDGTIFGNFEHRLPEQERGYYREFTVVTPGENDRGRRRLIAGAAGDIYYTDDHYETFRQVLR
jgi:ribonuclease T1